VLQLASTQLYVTADQSGSTPLAASRDIISAWEKFIIRQKTGAGDGVYSIKAASNGLYVTVGGDGSLINNGENEAGSAGFQFMEA
jgi:endo-1,3(4)-beta-glucanase